MSQWMNEKIEEWKECEGRLAMNTFDPLPSVGISPRNTIAMAKKFCTGSLDKESWIHATSLYPELHEKSNAAYFASSVQSQHCP